MDGHGNIPSFKGSRSAITESLLYIDGKLVSLKDYPFHYAIYDGAFPSILLKTARQISKSTLAANFTLAESIAIPFFKTLYVAPTKEQTSKFSNTRLSKTINYSPLLKQKFAGGDGTDNVMLKVLNNGSEVALSYAQDDADRIRGISADRIILDEIQDCDLGAIIPVIRECSANSNYGWITQAGTPKSLENGIEDLWVKSTQSEWIMKCDGCGSWNFIDGVKSIGLNGPICVKCGHGLNPRAGQWYDFNPGARAKGFHVSQPMLPLNCENPLRWDRILEKVETYPVHKLKNEVLGVSDSLGTRMLSKEDLEALCDPRFHLDRPPKSLEYSTVVGGCDWSGGGVNEVSRTVVWIWAVLPNHKLKVLYYKIFPGTNPVSDVAEVAAIADTFRVRMMVCDAGVGALANAFLREKLGPHRVIQTQYGANNQLIQWNKKDRYLIDKTAFVDSYMMLLKTKGVVYADIREMTPAINDTLAEYEEITAMGRKIWRHANSAPDDALHAQIFGWIAARIVTGELQLYRGE